MYLLFYIKKTVELTHTTFVIMIIISNYLMVTIAALSPQTSRDVHSTKERLLVHSGATKRDILQLRLHVAMVPLVNDVIDTVALGEHIDLKSG